MIAKRFTKGGYPIYKEWYEYAHYDAQGNGRGLRTRYVLTNCATCTANFVPVALSRLVRDGPKQCDGCEAYNDHLF